MAPWKIAVVAVLALGLGAAGAVYYAYDRYNAPGPHDRDVTVIIPDGASLTATTARLRQAGVVSSGFLFKWGTRLKGADRDIRAGEYEIPARASMTDILAILRSGKVVQYKITIPEGLTSAEVVALVNGADALAGEVTQIPPEGSLLPETYQYVRGVARADLIARMKDALDETLAKLWAARDVDHAPATPEAAVILASIVEKETGLAEERPRVAAVFLNRLKKRMRLQSDPTVVYALTKGAPLGRRLTRDDLEVASPYNTYLHYGLPPGPIANPGVQSLKAVLNPIGTDELYFVADGTGGHTFARTLKEHIRNVRKWRRIRKEQEKSVLGGEAAEQPVEPGGGQQTQQPENP